MIQKKLKPWRTPEWSFNKVTTRHESVASTQTQSTHHVAKSLWTTGTHFTADQEQNCSKNFQTNNLLFYDKLVNFDKGSHVTVTLFQVIRSINKFDRSNVNMFQTRRENSDTLNDSSRQIINNYGRIITIASRLRLSNDDHFNTIFSWLISLFKPQTKDSRRLI